MTKRVSLWRFLLTAGGMTLVSQAVHSAAAVLEMGYYKDPQYFPVWSKLMMPTAGPPPPSFFYYSLALGLVEWIFFLAVFRLIRGGIPAPAGALRGVVYGGIVFLVGSLGQGLGLGLLVNLPYGLLALWVFESLVVDLANGWVAGKIEG